jgi:hypothetical protein
MQERVLLWWEFHRSVEFKGVKNNLFSRTTKPMQEKVPGVKIAILGISSGCSWAAATSLFEIKKNLGA